MLTDLLRVCGPDEVVELVTSGRLELTYLPSSLGVLTDNTGSAAELHRPAVFSVPQAWDLQHALPGAFKEVLGKPGRARRMAAKVEPHVQQYVFDDALANAAMADFLRAEYLSAAATIALRELAPTYVQLQDLRFEATQRGERLVIDTNVDFAEAARAHHRVFPREVSGLSPALILGQVFNALGELHLAALYTSELATDPASDALIRHRCAAVVVRRDARAASIEAFQELVLRDGRALRDAVNSGARSFAEVLAFLEKADQFRDWLESQEPTADLVGEYMRSVTESTWVEGLPAKAVRWAVATGLGMALAGPGGAVAGGALGLFDTFVLERLVRGWRPNQFIDDEMRRFVRP